MCAAGLSLCLFLAGLTSGERALGVWMLLLGWASYDTFHLWLANPLLMVGWLLLLFHSTRYLALFCTAAAFALALSFLADSPLPDGPVYWLWLGSTVVALVGALCSVWLGRPQGVRSRLTRRSEGTA